MMKWGRSRKHDRKKNTPTDAASPSCPLLSSWFSKFKKSDRRLPDPEREDEGGSRFMQRKIEGSPGLSRCWGEEEFRRMSFGKDGEKFPPSVCRSCLSVIVEEEEEGAMKFDEMVSNVHRMRELERDFGNIELNVKERETEPCLRAATEHDRECPREDRQSQRKTPRSARESKKSPRRRSRHVKVRSPRLNSTTIKVRRSKKGRDGHHREGDGSKEHYQRYALVKCSYDPQGDFRESMMEMITARGIRGTAEEMEELLACYLILNDDAYHDVIIKVFRQVCFELSIVIKEEDQQRPLPSGQ